MSADPKAQTERSFSDKWTNNPELVLRQTLQRGSDVQQWILNRNGYRDFDDAARQLAGCRRILDAGCGNGRVSILLAQLAPRAAVLGIDLADVGIARRNAAAYRNVEFRQADLRGSLAGLGRFDLIYCQEVLHHTGDAEGVFSRLVELLEPAGRIAIYVYRRKAPAREYMDDYVRERISDLPYDDAMRVCRSISELGKALTQAGGEVEVGDIPVLGIEKGRYTPQRLLYNFFLKCYWNPGLSEEENAAINFDWYHPQQCTRHTTEEVLGWFASRGLKLAWQHTDAYGITAHGIR